MLEHFVVFGKVFRNLLFLTSPMEMNRPKLLFGRRSDSCVPAFLAWLKDSSATWDILDIEEQLHDAQTEKLREWFKTLGYLVTASETICPYIELDSAWDQFLSSCSRRMRSNINRLRRRLNDLGDIRVRRVDRWPELDGALDVHCDVEGQSWKSGKHLRLTSDKSHLFFYRSLAEVFGTRGEFDLRILECNGEPIASTFGIRRNKVFLSLKIAHDERFDKNSPGTVLESFELEDLFRTDLEMYDLMGSFLSNKLRWTSTVTKVTNLFVYQRRPRLVMHYFIYSYLKRHVRTALRYIGQFDRAVELLKRLRGNSSTRR